MQMQFKDRLKQYRESLEISTKTEMAKFLGIARSLYSMLENGEREPSQDVLDKLVLRSDKPEEYWLYGVESEKEYLKSREEFKMVKRMVYDLINIGVITDEEISENVCEVLLAALKADIKHIILKMKQE